MKKRNPVIEFDDLQIYFAEPYIIDVPSAQGTLTIHQPSFRDLIRFGEKRFFSGLNPLITNTTSYRYPLWKMGIDWNEFSDFDLFLLLYKDLDVDVMKCFFDDVDLTKFGVYEKTVGEDVTHVLYDEDLEIEINEEVYWHFSQYLRKVFNMNPEEKITKDPILKQWYINQDERQMENERKLAEKGKTKSHSILPLISACVNHPGFKYSINELKDITIGQFYDSVSRLQVYENTTALLKGMYSGFVDGKSIKPENYNFMKEI